MAEVGLGKLSDHLALRDVEDGTLACGQRPVAKLLLSNDALAQRDLGRYLYLLVKYLDLSGYQIKLAADHDLLAQIRSQKFAMLLLKQGLVTLSDQRCSDAADLIIHDCAANLSTVDSGARRLNLVMGRRLTMAPERYDVLFPYMLHPKFYMDGSFSRVTRLRNQERTMRLFFSGNNSARYANEDIQSRYGLSSRASLLRQLLEGLGTTEILRITRDNADLMEQSEFRNKFTYVDVLSGYRVAKSRWLETLGRSDFFLACPGVDMPLSHNLVEAMSVGSIPLTQYGKFFDPPLRDGIECVAHNGLDVVETAQAALAMDEQKIRALRRGATRYYDRYLTPEAFKYRILRDPRLNLRLGLNFMPE